MIKRLWYFVVVILAVSGTVSAQSERTLFTFSNAESGFSEKSSIASVEERVIVFDSSRFAESSDAIYIPLMDGKTYRANATSIETRAMDDRTWRGKLVHGKNENDVILTFHKGYVSGLIYAPDAVYEIIPRGNVHILARLDQVLFPECGGEVQSEEKPTLPEVAAPQVLVDSGDRIDVLVVYTTATKNFLGGDAQARAHAQASIDATNTAYINSRIRQRVRMVHSEEFVYTETSSASTDLSNLRNNAGIQALRNTHNADLVAKISEASGVCGIGYLMGSQAGNQNNGFTVTARSCAVGNLSFAHELGHNMGSQHNPENGSGATFSYGYGHYVNGSYRTVMSYVDPCTNGCARRPYFSNPTVSFNGFPTGVDNARDNVRSINRTADAISNYRASGSSLMLQTYFDGGILPRGIRRTLTWQSENVTGNVRIEMTRDDGLNWQTIIASTPNDGSEPITIWGPATKTARIRIASIDSPHVTDTSIGAVAIR